MKPEVVLVHTGNFFPDYINDCIYQLKKYNLKITLIISCKLIPKVIHKNIKIECAEHYQDENYLNFNLNNHDNNYADGFWTRTSSRFFLLKNYARQNNTKSFFHIENDVLIFSNLIKIQEKLNSLNFECSIVMDCIDRCVPSILWFRNYSILEIINEHISLNNNMNDMENLSILFHKYRNRICNFPILSDSMQLQNIDYSNMYNLFNSIFDGAAIGQYLAGTHANPNLKNFINEKTIFNPSDYNYIWENAEPYMIHLNKKIKINNLHIHSKNLKQYIYG
jgi:hypothetical protein